VQPLVPKDTSEMKNYSSGGRGIIFLRTEKYAYFRNTVFFTLIENMPDDQKKAVRWYIDDGDDDFFMKETAWFI